MRTHAFCWWGSTRLHDKAQGILDLVPVLCFGLASSLDLRPQCNRLTSIPDSITALTNLDYLSCHSNSIQTVT